MAKTSLNPKDAQQGGLSFGEGWATVTSAKSAVHQLPPSKTSGEQESPATKLVLELQRCGEDGKSDGTDPVIEYLAVCRPNKETGLLVTTPGLAKSRTDPNPKDLGSEVGTEGNCFVGPAPYKTSKGATFIDSLVARGFRPEILNYGYLPDFEGMVAYFHTVKKAAISSGQKETDQLLVKEIKVYPYEKSAAEVPAVSSAPKPAKVSGPAKLEPHDVALKVLMLMSEKTPGVTIKLGDMRTKSFAAFAATKADAALKGEAKQLIVDPEWLATVAEDIGMEVTEDSITFA
jgi:hypothetical protein